MPDPRRRPTSLDFGDDTVIRITQDHSGWVPPVTALLRDRPGTDTPVYTEYFTQPDEPVLVQNEGMPGTTTQSRGCTCPACTDLRGEVAEVAPAGAIGDDLPEAYAPARGNQLRNISNGEYRFETGERDDTDQARMLTVQLWTVQSGQLQGQRILRRPSGNAPGGWQGFGTLQEDGTVWIWRSAAEELRGSRTHRVLNTQFRTMHHQGTRLRRNTREIFNGLSVSIGIQRCNVCNVQVSSPIAYCNTHLVEQTESIRTDESQYAAAVPRVAPRTSTARTRADLFAAQTRATAARPREVRQPLMSEIDPTRIR